MVINLQTPYQHGTVRNESSAGNYIQPQVQPRITEAVLLSLFSGLSGITFYSRCHSPNARALLFPLYEDWGLGFKTQDMIRYHVLPLLHPGCLLQVSGKTQNRQWKLCMCCYCINSPPHHCIREFWEQLTGHTTVSPRTWQQRSLPSGYRFVFIKSFLNTRLKCRFF